MCATGHEVPEGTAPGLGGRTASLDSAREHAEGEAALMRRAGTPREMTLYVNKRPCVDGTAATTRCRGSCHPVPS